jgi:DNA-binding NarL/FixJ family response regulator
VQVLLVDSYPMVRAALGGLIEQHLPGARVTGVDSVPAARAALAQSVPRLVLLDLKLEGGLELLTQIQYQHLMLPVVVISGSGETEDALVALRAGAHGYLPASSDIDTLIEALKLVLHGGTYVPELKPLADEPDEPAVTEDDELAALPLTPRQRHVLRLLKQGLSNKLIARELGLSPDTVKDHVAAVLKALGVSSRTQAALVATRKNRL